jgi:hypothetical protein
MTDDDSDQQDQRPTQRTPKGLEIPVPTRKDVMDALRKVSKPDKPEKDERRPSDAP